MKKGLIFLFGWSPLLVGTALNGLMMRFRDTLPPLLTIGVGLLLAWALFGRFTVRLGEKLLPSLLLLNLPAALFLSLLLYQALVLGQYWFNVLGRCTQLFYLPLINLSSRLLVGLFHSLPLPPVYLLSFLLLCGASGLGRYLGERRN